MTVLLYVFSLDCRAWVTFLEIPQCLPFCLLLCSLGLWLHRDWTMSENFLWLWGSIICTIDVWSEHGPGVNFDRPLGHGHSAGGGSFIGWIKAVPSQLGHCMSPDTWSLWICIAIFSYGFVVFSSTTAQHFSPEWENLLVDCPYQQR